MTNLLARLFVRDYRNTASPAVRRAYGTMVSVVGMVLNLLLFGAKFTVGMLTKPQSTTPWRIHPSISV